MEIGAVVAACLVRRKGLQEGEVRRGDALMITSSCQAAVFPPTEIDGVE